MTGMTQPPNLQELFGLRAVSPAKPRVAGPSFAEVQAAEIDALEPAPAPPRTPGFQAKLEAWEGMFYDPATGEGIVSPREGEYLHTGWFFERPMQHQPTPGGSLEDRAHLEPICPFGFLSEGSAKRMMDLLAQFLPPDAQVTGIEAAEANPSFPYTVAQREIVVSAGGNTFRFPAGLLAREMCCYTYAGEDGGVRQNMAATLQRAVAEHLKT